MDTKLESKPVVRRDSEPDRPPSKPSSVDADAIVTMDVAGLFAAIIADKSIVSEVVRLRPSVVGELIQRAFVSGSPLAAMVLVTELRNNTRQFAGTHGQLVFRSVMRLEGPGAEEVRAVMESFVRDDNEIAAKRASFPDGALIDSRLNALQGAKKDPAWAKLSVDYYERPEAAAAQLLREAKQDPKLFRKHAGNLGTLFASSRTSARFFVHELLKLEGEMSSEVKLWVVAQLHGILGGEMNLIDKGLNDHVDGGPRARAQQLVPILAELISDPAVAQALVTVGRSGRSPAPVPPLKHLLADVLHWQWPKSVRNEARGYIRGGAAQLLHGSLTATEPHERKARTVDAANFIGQTAQAECQRGLDKSFSSTLGDMLLAASNIMPGPAGAVSKYGGTGLKLAGKSGDEQRQYTEADVHAFTRKVYERVNPPPEDAKLGTEPRNEYEYKFVSWQADAANEFARLEQDARREEDCAK